jgi:hypothetical protein
MAEDEWQVPTIEEYRALLAAVRVWEATNRPGVLPQLDIPCGAYEWVVVLGDRLGLFSRKPWQVSAWKTHDLLWRAARGACYAVVHPFHSEPGEPFSKPGRPPASVRPADVLGKLTSSTDERRANLSSAIDALAAAIDLEVESVCMLPAVREAIEDEVKKSRAGRPPENDDRDAAAWKMRAAGEKWSVIARTLGFSSGNHAGKQARSWAKRNLKKGT